MPIEKSQTGSGITKQPSVKISAPHGEQEIEAFSSMIDELGTTLAGKLESIEQAAGTVLDEAGLPTAFGVYLRDVGGRWASSGGRKLVKTQEVKYARGVWSVAEASGFQRDSKEGYTARAIDHIGQIREALAAGDTERGALESMQLGGLLAEARMKGRWEPTTLGGQRFNERMEDAREKAAKSKKEAAEARQAAWQEKAEEIWAKNPDLSKNAVAILIADDPELIKKHKRAAPGTIRKKITKPR